MKSFFIKTSIILTIFFGVLFLPLFFVIFFVEANWIKWLLMMMSFLLTSIVASMIWYFSKKNSVTHVDAIKNAIDQIVDDNYKLQLNSCIRDKNMGGLIDHINFMASEFDRLKEIKVSFIANASHELRSPLNNLQLYLTALADGVIEDENIKMHYINTAKDEAKRLTKLVENILSMSTYEENKLKFNQSKFDINQLVEKVADRFEPTLTKAEIQLDKKLSASNTLVYADMQKIEQVVSNLIDNAIKYSPRFSTVTVRTYTQGLKMFIVVHDQGFGISKKEQPFIWDKFYMVDKARTPQKAKGTGLGLAIVKTIITQHREIIWVDSNKGEGAKFVFTLPLFDPKKHMAMQQAYDSYSAERAYDAGFKANYKVVTISKPNPNQNKKKSKKQQNPENYRWGM